MEPSQSRRILVTGAASGIGAAACRALAGPGTTILVHTRRNRDGVERTAAAVRAAGGAAHVALGDLAEPGTPGALVAQARELLGGLDVLVSNAGHADRTPVAALQDAAMAHSLDAIPFAFLRLARAALPLLRDAAQGRVIAVGSFVSHSFRAGVPVFPASAAAKAAQEALVRALAMELAPAGVTVNCVVPGLIRKDSGAQAALSREEFRARAAAIPLGRLGEPADVAAVIAFLASPGAAYVTGQAIHVDGGLVIRP